MRHKCRHHKTCSGIIICLHKISASKAGNLPPTLHQAEAVECCSCSQQTCESTLYNGTNDCHLPSPAPLALDMISSSQRNECRSPSSALSHQHPRPWLAAE